MDDDKLFDHQDWKHIVIQSKIKKNTNDKVFITKQNIHTTEKKIMKQIEEGDLKHVVFKKEFVISFIKKRCELKLTQKQIASKLNVPHSKIIELENGVCLYDSNFNNKLKRILKI
tara:strand:+ start:317 stop:661 length:345 start_codon:yes stop_codon:yes gene_type:complete